MVKKLFLVRDQSGEKPLYYVCQQRSKCVFGSEIGCVRVGLKADLSLNLNAIWDMPTFLWVPQPETIFKEIFSLEKGEMANFPVV